MKYRYQSRDQVYEITIERLRLQAERAGYRASVDGENLEVEVLASQPGEISLRCAGQTIRLYWAAEGTKKWISVDGCTYLLERPVSRRSRRPGEASSEGVLRSPMPAQVRSIHVHEGEAVNKGDNLLLLEAMKMEIRIQAPRSGRIGRLPIREGQTVEQDQVLVEIVD